jgi:hypothetical protein
MRELVEHLQDAIEALKREIVCNPKGDKYRKALKGTGERLAIAKQILVQAEARRQNRRRKFSPSSTRRPGRGRNRWIALFDLDCILS